MPKAEIDQKPRFLYPRRHFRSRTRPRKLLSSECFERPAANPHVKSLPCTVLIVNPFGSPTWPYHFGAAAKNIIFRKWMHAASCRVCDCAGKLGWGRHLYPPFQSSVYLSNGWQRMERAEVQQSKLRGHAVPSKQSSDHDLVSAAHTLVYLHSPAKRNVELDL